MRNDAVKLDIEIIIDFLIIKHTSQFLVMVQTVSVQNTKPPPG